MLNTYTWALPGPKESTRIKGDLVTLDNAWTRGRWTARGQMDIFAEIRLAQEEAFR